MEQKYVKYVYLFISFETKNKQITLYTTNNTNKIKWETTEEEKKSYDIYTYLQNYIY